MSDTSLEQVPYTDIRLAENPEPRCPCVLLLDNSGSMRGQPLDELNEGLRQFQDELMSDELAAKRVEVAIVTFGPVNTVMDFTEAQLFQAPHLTVAGDTPMGQAIETGLDMVRNRKAAYRANGVAYYRPWVFLITDGGPTDSWQNAARLVREGEQSKSFTFFPVGVEGADFEKLAQISVREPLRLQALKFRELFSWLSASLKAVSHSNPGDVDTVVLQDPTGPKGWAVV